jgi:hypothetical protein
MKIQWQVNHHPRHFPVQLTDAVATNDKVGWIENKALHEIQRRAVHFGRSGSIKSKMN